MAGQSPRDHLARELGRELTQPPNAAEASHVVEDRRLLGDSSDGQPTFDRRVDSIVNSASSSTRPLTASGEGDIAAAASGHHWNVPGDGSEGPMPPMRFLPARNLPAKSYDLHAHSRPVPTFAWHEFDLDLDRRADLRPSWPDRVAHVCCGGACAYPTPHGLISKVTSARPRPPY